MYLMTDGHVYLMTGDHMLHQVSRCLSHRLVITCVCICHQMFNSRTCQLILGAGALQLVGLKTITTKNLGVSCLVTSLAYILSIFDIFLTDWSSPFHSGNLMF